MKNEQSDNWPVHTLASKAANVKASYVNTGNTKGATLYLQINTVKYDADQEIMITYENLQIVRSQLFTDMLIFIYFQSN